MSHSVRDILLLAQETQIPLRDAVALFEEHGSRTQALVSLLNTELRAAMGNSHEFRLVDGHVGQIGIDLGDGEFYPAFERVLAPMDPLVALRGLRKYAPIIPLLERVRSGHMEFESTHTFQGILFAEGAITVDEKSRRDGQNEDMADAMDDVLRGA